MPSPGEARDPIVVRPRTAADLDRCVGIARAVHEADGYPPYLPDGDFRRLLASSDALGTWVAEVGDDLIGHVSLHRRSSEPVMRLAGAELGVGPERLGVVARLFVDPGRRRMGIGARLLETVVDDARNRDRLPILDVWTGLPAAIALYERLGWRRLGVVDVQLPGGSPMSEIVFAAT